MQATAGKRFGLAALALLLVALTALALTATRAEAASWWADDAENSLTVQAIHASEGNQAMADDLKTADIRVDVYKIGGAVPDEASQTFAYTLDEQFEGLTLTADMKAEDWDNLAQGAADIVWPPAQGEDAQGRENQQDPSASAKVGEKIEGLPNGVYLVLAHGVEANDLVARADAAQYAFSPTVITLPSKTADANGQMGTAWEYGAWLSDVQASLKPQQAPLFGSLVIEKAVRGYAGEPATFVFHVVDSETGGQVYDNYASMLFSSETGEQVMLTHIPAALQVTVEEVYSGARYRALTGPQDAKIVSDAAVEAGAPIASVAFENEANGSGVGGHGVNNNFELQESGDWAWTQTPVAVG